MSEWLNVSQILPDASEYCDKHARQLLRNEITFEIPKYGDLKYKHQCPKDLYAHIRCQLCKKKYEDDYSKGIYTIVLPSIKDVVAKPSNRKDAIIY